MIHRWIGAAKAIQWALDGQRLADLFGIDYRSLRSRSELVESVHAARPEPGACGDPACPVLHDDPANPIHPCPVCWGEGCEAGCGRRGGCEMADVGPDSHRICGHCHGSGEAPPAARQEQP